MSSVKSVSWFSQWANTYWDCGIADEVMYEVVYNTITSVTM